MERKNAAAAAEAESTLVGAEAQETERISMKRSSKVANQQGGIAQHEHGRQDGWTSTLRGNDYGKKVSERDRMAGERLQIQRPHPLLRQKVKKMHMKSKQEMAAAAAATCGQESDCRNNANLVMSILNTTQKNILVHKFRSKLKRQVLSCSIPAKTRACSRTTTEKVTTSAAAKKNEEFFDKDAEILRLIDERRRMPKGEKQRLKDLSKSIKIASEKKE